MAVGPDARPDRAQTRALRNLTAAIESGNVEEVNRIARLVWIDVLSTDLDALRRRLLELEPEVRNGNPLLLLLLGIATLPSRFRRAHAIRYFLQATRVARSRRDSLDPIDVALALIGEAVASRVIGPKSRAKRAAERAALHLRSLDDDQLGRLGGVPLLFSQVGRSLYDADDAGGAITLFEEGLAAIDFEDPDLGFENLALICSINVSQGELLLAEEYLELARSDIWDERVTRNYLGTHYRLAEARLALEEWDPARAEEQLGSMEHDPRTIEDWVEIAAVTALISVFHGRPDAGLNALERTVSSRGREGRSPTARKRLAPIRALLETAQGNPGKAQALLARDAAPGPARSVGLARAALAMDSPGEALRHLQQCSGHPLETPRLQFESLVVELAARLRIPAHRPPATLARRIAGLAESTGLRIGLSLLGEADAAAVRAALVGAGHSDLYADGSRALLIQTHALSSLTARERTVFELLASGHTAVEISQSLFVSINTVKTQVRSVYRKLGFRSREEVIAFAAEIGLLHPGSAANEDPSTPQS